MLQCVAVCCSVLQCAAVCCSVLQCVAVCCSVFQCVAVCCSVNTASHMMCISDDGVCVRVSESVQEREKRKKEENAAGLALRCTEVQFCVSF